MLSDLVERSILDLPVTPTATVLQRWISQLSQLQDALPALRCRLILDERSRSPESGLLETGSSKLNVERDPQSLRGTGGLLSDLLEVEDGEAFALIADAAQLLTTDLVQLCSALQQVNADVVLTADDESKAGGVTLLRTNVLRHVPKIGFSDLKEQVLPNCRQHGFSVRVLRQPQLPGRPIRDARDYLEVVRRENFNSFASDPAVDGLRFSSLVEDGASVDSTAHVHDSVVLRGARIERGARVIRSIICPGAVVRAAGRVADEIVGRSARRELSRR